MWTFFYLRSFVRNQNSEVIRSDQNELILQPSHSCFLLSTVQTMSLCMQRIDLLEKKVDAQTELISEINRNQLRSQTRLNETQTTLNEVENRLGLLSSKVSKVFQALNSRLEEYERTFRFLHTEINQIKVNTQKQVDQILFALHTQSTELSTLFHYVNQQTAAYKRLEEKYQQVLGPIDTLVQMADTSLPLQTEEQEQPGQRQWIEKILDAQVHEKAYVYLCQYENYTGGATWEREDSFRVTSIANKDALMLERVYNIDKIIDYWTTHERDSEIPKAYLPVFTPNSNGPIYFKKVLSIVSHRIREKQYAYDCIVQGSSERVYSRRESTFQVYTYYPAGKLDTLRHNRDLVVQYWTGKERTLPIRYELSST